MLLGVAAAGEPARLDGRLLERGSDRPLAGVPVRACDTNTITNSDGNFVFDALPPGLCHIVIQMDGHTASADETLLAGARRSVVYRLSRGPAFVSTVRAEQRHAAVETQLATDEARHVAGSGGDALKVVQDLPGVARASFGQGQLIVWGAAPADTRVYVDDVEVPLLYHLGGFRSTVNDALVRNIDFIPGGYGADFGRGLGGLVRLETRPLTASGIHGYVGADVLDASALIEAALGKRLSIALAGRYSYLDKLLSGLISPSVGDYVPIPRWDDYQLKATLRLRADEQLALTFLGADDRLTRSLPSSDPALVRSERTEQSYYRLSLRYTRATAESNTTATAYFGFDHSLTSDQFGGTPTQLGVDGWRYGVRALGRRRVARWAAVTIGADVAGVRSEVDRVGSLTLPAREGDVYVFGQAPAGDVSAERFSIHQLDAAVFVEAELKAGPVTITPGLRAGAVLLEGDHSSPPPPTTPVPGFAHLDWLFEPRLQIVWRVTPRLLMTAAAGLYHQAPDPADLSAVFGNPNLELQRAWHVTHSMNISITDWLSIDIAGFVKGLDMLVSRSALPSPPLGQALVQDGSGFVYGGQLLVRARAWHGLSGWIGYTLSHSERQDHPNSPTRLFDYDQPNVLSVVASYAIAHFGVGARLRWSSGFPRTPVTGAFWDARDDQYQPLFGAQNSIRLPDFVQLDLRAEYTFVFRRAALNLYLDVQNITNRQNAEELAYRQDYSNAANPGYVTGLPTTAVLGARVQF